MVIIENNMEHFHSLCCNEVKLVNFHARAMVCNYDIIKHLSKEITWDCAVFIPVSIGRRIMKIDQEMREL